MATQIILDGPRNCVVKLTASDVIDISALEGSPGRVNIKKIVYDVGATEGVVVDWDATTDVTAVTLSGHETMCFEDIGGLPPPSPRPAGFTGDVAVTGTGTFTVVLYLIKHND